MAKKSTKENKGVVVQEAKEAPKAKITSLTAEQREKMKDYAQWGIDAGLSCAPIDDKGAAVYSERLMGFLNRPYKRTIVVGSPLTASAVSTAYMSADSIWRDMDGKATAKVNAADIVLKTVAGRIDDKAKFGVTDTVIDAVLGALRRGSSANTRETVAQKARESLANAKGVWPYLDGQWMSYYTAWYNYYQEVLGLELPPAWVINDQINFGGVWPLTDIVVVSRRPEHILRDSTGRLHADGKAAVQYCDGFSIYALNGVRVPEWLALTSESAIDPARFAEIANAEVRQVFIRKVGIERIAQACGAETVDTNGDYDLWMVDLKGQTGKRPYLKMINPSTGTWHLEGVPVGTKTVADALVWRNGSALTPTQLT
ncbi:MAG: hypothetical protein LBT97_03100 [Planctomycetota bacterium]|jgi:hypothetical protein|nr:hypothetical protein [Planctomycetota bacterium]